MCVAQTRQGLDPNECDGSDLTLNVYTLEDLGTCKDLLIKITNISSSMVQPSTELFP